MMCMGRLSESARRIRRRTPPSMVRSQRGGMLIEALVGILLSAALGLGMAYSAARALNTQRYTSTQNLAVMDMRLLLATSGACISGTVSAASGAGSGALAGLSYERSCITLTPTISAAGTSVSTTLSRTQELKTSTSSTTSALFGGDGVISFGQ
jgi:hypothetical protein